MSGEAYVAGRGSERRRSGGRREVCIEPGDVKQGRVLIVVRATDKCGGRSFIVAGEIVEDIEVKSGIAALGLVFIDCQLREGKRDDNALDGRHAYKRQALHGAERLDRHANEVGGLVLAFPNAVTHSAERYRDRISNKQKIHRGILHRTGELVPHIQSRAIDVKPTDFEVQAGLSWKRQCQIRQGPIHGSRQ